MINTVHYSGETPTLVSFILDTDDVPTKDWYTELLTALRDYVAENDVMVYTVHFATHDDSSLELNAVIH